VSDMSCWVTCTHSHITVIFSICIITHNVYALCAAPNTPHRASLRTFNAPNTVCFVGEVQLSEGFTNFIELNPFLEASNHVAGPGTPFLCA
jgi:hypothetical protein